MMRPIKSRGWVAASALVALLPAMAHRAPSSPSPKRITRTVWDSVYSLSQAATGEAAYAKTCARCHGASLTGGDESPPLTGGGFLGNWNGLPLSDLQTRIRTTMPTDTVGIYGQQLVTDVIAYVLKSNGFPPGSADLPSDAAVLKQIMVQTSKP